LKAEGIAFEYDGATAGAGVVGKGTVYSSSNTSGEAAATVNVTGEKAGEKIITAAQVAAAKVIPASGAEGNAAKTYLYMDAKRKAQIAAAYKAQSTLDVAAALKVLNKAKEPLQGLKDLLVIAKAEETK